MPGGRGYGGQDASFGGGGGRGRAVGRKWSRGLGRQEAGMGSSGAAPVGAAREGMGEEVSGPGAAAACPHQPPALHGGAAARFASPGRRPLPPLVARRGREGRRKTPERLPGEPAPRCSVGGAGGVTWAASAARPSWVRAEAPGRGGCGGCEGLRRRLGLVPVPVPVLVLVAAPSPALLSPAPPPPPRPGS